MKKVFTGWIGKASKEDLSLLKSQGLVDEFRIFTSKGKKSIWPEEDWPPIKIKLTVEIPERK